MARDRIRVVRNRVMKKKVVIMKIMKKDIMKKKVVMKVMKKDIMKKEDIMKVMKKDIMKKNVVRMKVVMKKKVVMRKKRKVDKLRKLRLEDREVLLRNDRNKLSRNLMDIERINRRIIIRRNVFNVDNLFRTSPIFG